MTHQTRIERIMLEAKPDVTPSTIRTYVSAINSICRKAGIEPSQDAFAKDFQRIINHVDVMASPASRRAYFSACLFFLKPTNHEEAKEAYMKKFQEMKKTIREKEDKQEATEKFKALRQEHFTWETVLKYREEYEKEYHEDLFSDKVKGHRLLWKIQQYVALCCYTMIEPRRSQDYCDFVLRDPDVDSQNYMMERDGTYYFVFTSYKTAGHYGKQTIEIPTELADIIHQWAKISSSKFLLMQYKRLQPMTSPNICHMLYDIFDNRKVSVNLLRHLYLAQFVEQDKKMKEIATRMGHSIGMQHHYIYQDQEEKEA
jgi:flagellar biosynthesis regulator FlbT